MKEDGTQHGLCLDLQTYLKEKSEQQEFERGHLWFSSREPSERLVCGRLSPRSSVQRWGSHQVIDHEGSDLITELITLVGS